MILVSALAELRSLADAVSGMPFAVLKICGNSPPAPLGTVLREKVVLMLHQA